MATVDLSLGTDATGGGTTTTGFDASSSLGATTGAEDGSSGAGSGTDTGSSTHVSTSSTTDTDEATTEESSDIGDGGEVESTGVDETEGDELGDSSETMGSTESTESTGGDGDESLCLSMDQICLPVPPQSWQGPHLVFDDHPQHTCEGVYDTRLDSLHAGLDEGSFKCKCSCDPEFESFECSAVSGGIHDPDDPTCGDPPLLGEYSLEPGECKQVHLSGGGLAYLETGAASLLAGARCRAQSDHDIGTAAWRQSDTLCGASQEFEQLDCPAASLCVEPATAGGQLCIVREGEHSCPAGPFAERSIRYAAALIDERRCSSCDCGGGTAECGGMVHYGGSCPIDGSSATVSAGLGTCSSYPETLPRSLQVHYETELRSAACEARGGDRLGAVHKTGAKTLCCLESWSAR